jgi:hypothetical protein
MGNPKPVGSSNDPGYQNQIFAARYSSGNVADGNRFRLPDGISYQEAENCNLAFSATTFETVHAYSESLATRATVSGKAARWGVSARFSASAEYDTAKNELSKATSTMVQSEVECTVYQTSIQKFNPPPFSANFLIGLQTLTENYDADVYNDFLNAFGTHYVISTSMGAIFGEQSFVSDSSIRELESRGFTLETSAKVSGYGASVEASGEVAKSTEQLTEFRKVATGRNTYTRGSRPPINNSTREWANSIFEEPQPIKIQLSRLDTIFGLDQVVSSPSILTNIGRAIDDFCVTNGGAQCDLSSQMDVSFTDFSVPKAQPGAVLDTQGHFLGVLEPVVMCNEGAYVMDVQIFEVLFVGIVNIGLICSDGINKNIVESDASDSIVASPSTNCGSRAIDELRPYGQVHCCNTLAGVYNIVGLEYSCTDDFSRVKLGYTPFAGENERLFCPSGEHIIGIQAALAEGSDRGLARIRLVCGKVDDE